MGVKRSASFNVKEGAKIVHYSDLSSGIQYLPADGIINIQSEKIRIGGFGVNATSFYKINETGVPYDIGAPLSIYLSNVGIPSSSAIGGSEGTKNWLFTIGNDFGVTVGGTLYARNGIFQGEVQATSGKIGNVIIQDGAIVSANGNFKVDSTGNLYIENKSSNDILTSIQQNTENIALKVSTSDFTGENLVSLINLSPDTVKISASHVNITGFVTFDNLATSGETTINGDNVTTGLIKSANYIAGTVFSQSGSAFNLETGDIITTGFRAYGGSGSARFKGEIQAESGNIGNITISNGAIESQNGGFKVTSLGDLSATSGKIASFSITPTGLFKEESSQYIGLGGEYAYWAGATASETPSTAPFRVDYDGSLYATKGEIGQFTLTQYAIHSKTKQSFNDNNDGIYLGTKDDKRTLVDELANGLVDENGNELYAFESTTDFFGIGRRDGAHLFYDGNGIDLGGISRIGDTRNYAEMGDKGLGVYLDRELVASYGEEANYYAFDDNGKKFKVVTISNRGIDAHGVPVAWEFDTRERYKGVEEGFLSPSILMRYDDYDEEYSQDHYTIGVAKTNTGIATEGEFMITTSIQGEVHDTVSGINDEGMIVPKPCQGTVNGSREIILNETGTYANGWESYIVYDEDENEYHSRRLQGVLSLTPTHVISHSMEAFEIGEEGTDLPKDNVDYYDFTLKGEGLVLRHTSIDGVDSSTELTPTGVHVNDFSSPYFPCFSSLSGNEFVLAKSSEVQVEDIEEEYQAQEIRLNLQENKNVGMELTGNAAYIDFHSGVDGAWQDYTHRLLADSRTNLIAVPGISNSSDERLKFDINDLGEKWLSLIDNIKPVSFRYNRYPDSVYLGLIAQNVLQNLEELDFPTRELSVVSEFTENEEDYYAIDYTQLIAPLILGYQKLKKRVEELEKGGKDGD